ncbi:MAG: helix-turn-helix domain-containing protein [Pseudomonadota bacterium]
MTKSNKAREELGRRIKVLRAASNLSQAQLAEKVGVSFQQIQKYESGRSELTISRLLSIAKALDVSTEEIIGFYPSSVRDGKKKRGHGKTLFYDLDDAEERIAIAVSPDEIELLSSLRKIADKTLHARILDLVKSISLHFKKK